MSEPAEIILTIAVCVAGLLITISIMHHAILRAKAKWKYEPGVQVEQFEARIANIENRLSDIQDIVIAIDDQLKRSNQHSSIEPQVHSE